jgi:hypothetical protein
MTALRLIAASLGAVVPLLATATAEASCVDSTRSPGAVVGYDTMQLLPSGIPSNLMSAFHEAYGAWNDSACNQGSTSFPSFQTRSERQRLD